MKLSQQVHGKQEQKSVWVVTKGIGASENNRAMNNVVRAGAPTCTTHKASKKSTQMGKMSTG